VASPVVVLRSRRYRIGVPFEVVADDGVGLIGSRVGRRGPSLIFCHGLLGWHRKLRIVRFVETLARRFSVYAFDLRGHGASGGLCTYGDQEVLDVEAVVRLARGERPDDPVVTLGVSMGGVAVIRHAALRDGVDAVVAISAPARWDGHTSRAVRRLRWMGGTDRGRALAAGWIGVRLERLDRWAEAPEDLVDRVAPTPLIVVHGRDDHFFDEEEAWRLYRRAREPKRLMLATRFGHAEDGLTQGLADRLAERIEDVLLR
jgi:alpha-beta hydrolase superfamily lysophospholipase